MGRRIVGRIINGQYIQTDEESHPAGEDYFHGVSPSSLRQLDERQLYLSSVRLYESVTSGVGMPHERANVAEALKETYRERNRRRATIR